MCSLTKFTTPTGKQTKDNYPNKLTDCQKQTKNPHFYLVGGGGREGGGGRRCGGGGNKTKQKQKQNKSSTVSILCLETEAVNP